MVIGGWALAVRTLAPWSVALVTQASYGKVDCHQTACVYPYLDYLPLLALLVLCYY